MCRYSPSWQKFLSVCSRTQTISITLNDGSSRRAIIPSLNHFLGREHQKAKSQDTTTTTTNASKLRVARPLSACRHLLTLESLLSPLLNYLPVANSLHEMMVRHDVMFHVYLTNLLLLIALLTTHLVLTAATTAATGTPYSSVSVSKRVQHTAPWQTTSTSSSSSSTATSSSGSTFDDLPPNVFAPGGRLYSVERNFEKANSEQDTSSNLVVALHCRDGVVVVSTSNRSPHLYTTTTTTTKMNSDTNNEKNNEINTASATNENSESSSVPNSSDPTITKTDEYQQSLWIKEDNDDDGTVASSMSLFTTSSSLNSNVIVRTGGCAVDSMLLKIQIEKLIQYMIEENDGGGFTNDVDARPTFVSASLLARRMADNLQEKTQTRGQMLASSALIVGPREQQPSTVKEENGDGDDALPPSPFCIWRVDPTGQFWDCNGTTIGRGARQAENHLLQRLTTAIKIAKMKNTSSSEEQQLKKQEETNDGDDHKVETHAKTQNSYEHQQKEQQEQETLQREIPSFLADLSATDALKIACQCIVDTLKLNQKVTPKEGDDDRKDTNDASDKKSILKQPNRNDDDTWNHMEAVILKRNKIRRTARQSSSATILEVKNGSELFQIYDSNNNND